MTRDKDRRKNEGVFDVKNRSNINSLNIAPNNEELLFDGPLIEHNGILQRMTNPKLDPRSIYTKKLEFNLASGVNRSEAGDGLGGRPFEELGAHFCAKASTSTSALAVALGSTLGAFLALGFIVLLVFLAKYQQRMKSAPSANASAGISMQQLREFEALEAAAAAAADLDLEGCLVEVRLTDDGVTLRGIEEDIILPDKSDNDDFLENMDKVPRVFTGKRPRLIKMNTFEVDLRPDDLLADLAIRGSADDLIRRRDLLDRRISRPRRGTLVDLKGQPTIIFTASGSSSPVHNYQQSRSKKLTFDEQLS